MILQVKGKDLMSNAYSTKPIQANAYIITWTSSINYIYFRTQIETNLKLTINIKVSNFNKCELYMEVDMISPIAHSVQMRSIVIHWILFNLERHPS